MAQNIEIKVAVADLEALRVAVLAFGAVRVGIEHQVDRYYELNRSERLKLRTIEGGPAQLIRYSRPESSAIRVSDYELTSVRDETAGLCLVPKREPVAIVRKEREILLWKNVRFHLDRVEGLGTFLELEAVVGNDCDAAISRERIDLIIQQLGLDPTRFIRSSYAEMIGGSDCAGA